MFLLRKCDSRRIAQCAMSSKPKSHYDSLGVKSNATQGEIKSAYYELSKQYHPDINKGSEESLAKFRQVTDAYEILGNVKSRRMYDRGLIVGVNETVLRQDDVEDDPTTRFYKSREKRSSVPTYSDGRQTVYDLDAWAKAHYGKTRIRKEEAKADFERLKQKNEYVRKQKDTEMVFISITAVLLVGIFYIMAETIEDHDRIKVPVKEAR